MSIKNFILTLTLLFMSVAIFTSTEAHANITILPTRVLFEDGDRFKEVTLVNTGNEIKTYEMSWSFFRMQENGSPYKPSEESVTEFDPSKYISFSPRRVTLHPGAKQKIKLVLRRPKEAIPPGDYHAHLRFAGIKEQPLTGQEQKKKTVVSINVGYTIPIVLRSGKADITAEIGPINLERNTDSGRLNAIIPIHRKGKPYAVMGHLYVYHVDKNGKEERVGEISNAHIFPEVSHRIIEVPLIKEISDGSLHIVLKNFDKKNDFIYAEKMVPLQ